MDGLLRDRLLARMREMGDAPDYQRLASDVLGIRGAPPDLARRLVAQALVVEDRREAWRQAGERICCDAPTTPGVYVLRDSAGTPLYVGKAVHLRRRLQAHFAERRWRAIKPEMSRVAAAEWIEVGSELEALLREAALIGELQPIVNVQVGVPELTTREIPRALVRDVIVIVPSVDVDAVEFVAARPDGAWMIQRSLRSGAGLAVDSRRLLKFFHSVLPRRNSQPPLAPIVFSWLAHRGAAATRIDPNDVRDVTELRSRLAALLRDAGLFSERLSVGDGL